MSGTKAKRKMLINTRTNSFFIFQLWGKKLENMNAPQAPSFMTTISFMELNREFMEGPPTFAVIQYIMKA